MRYPARSPELFEAYVTQRSMEFSVEEALALPGITVPASLAGAVPKRRAEFIAGRFCARDAIQLLTGNRFDDEIGIGEHYAPVWPSGIVGSISHKSGFASVAVARTSDVLGLGLDVEPVIAAEVGQSVHHLIAKPEELATIARETGWDAPLVLTLVFSAKESVFKCLYPIVRRYIDFHEVAATSIDPRGTVALRLVADLHATLPAGRRFEVRFEHVEGSMATALAIPASSCAG